MNLIALVLVLVVIGALVEGIKTYVAIDPLFLLVIRLLILIAVVYLVLAMLGLPTLPLPRAR